jgi:hypothetical protein
MNKINEYNENEIRIDTIDHFICELFGIDKNFYTISNRECFHVLHSFLYDIYYDNVKSNQEYTRLYNYLIEHNIFNEMRKKFILHCNNKKNKSKEKIDFLLQKNILEVGHCHEI